MLYVTIITSLLLQLLISLLTKALRSASTVILVDHLRRIPPINVCEEYLDIDEYDVLYMIINLHICILSISSIIDNSHLSSYPSLVVL